jgi:hypothetical protein
MYVIFVVTVRKVQYLFSKIIRVLSDRIFVAPCPNPITLVPLVFFRKIIELKLSPSQKLREILRRLHLQSAQLESTNTSIVGLPESQIPGTLLYALQD